MKSDEYLSAEQHISLCLVRDAVSFTYEIEKVQL